MKAPVVRIPTLRETIYSLISPLLTKKAKERWKKRIEKEIEKEMRFSFNTIIRFIQIANEINAQPNELIKRGNVTP